MSLAMSRLWLMDFLPRPVVHPALIQLAALLQKGKKGPGVRSNSN